MTQDLLTTVQFAERKQKMNLSTSNPELGPVCQYLLPPQKDQKGLVLEKIKLTANSVQQIKNGQGNARDKRDRQRNEEEQISGKPREIFTAADIN